MGNDTLGMYQRSMEYALKQIILIPIGPIVESMSHNLHEIFLRTTATGVRVTGIARDLPN